MRQSTPVITLLVIWIVSACSADGGAPSAGVTQAPLAASVEPASTVEEASTPTAATTASSTEEPPVIGTATLTTDACVFGAAAEAVAGSGFAISVVNDSADPAGFDLWLLHEDTPYEQWVEMAEQTQARIDADGDPGSHYDTQQFADPIDLQEAVDPLGKGALLGRAGAHGTYALQCWRFPATGPMRLMAAGPVAVNP